MKSHTIQVTTSSMLCCGKSLLSSLKMHIQLLGIDYEAKIRYTFGVQRKVTSQRPIGSHPRQRRVDLKIYYLLFVYLAVELSQAYYHFKIRTCESYFIYHIFILVMKASTLTNKEMTASRVTKLWSLKYNLQFFFDEILTCFPWLNINKCSLISGFQNCLTTIP